MFSTKTKLAFGYIILIILLLGAIGYVYKQMTLLTQPTGRRLLDRHYVPAVLTKYGYTPKP